MEISTTVKITLEEIKQMIADKKGIKHYFELQILDFDGTVLSSDTVKQPKNSPWYPDDSGEWVEVEMGKGKPDELKTSDIVEVLTNGERVGKFYNHNESRADSWGYFSIVAYKKVK